MESESGIVIDADSCQWRGQLPDRCNSVTLQYRKPGTEQWLSLGKASTALPREEAISIVEQGLQDLRFTKYEYRLVDAGNKHHREDQSMVAKKQAAKKAPAAKASADAKPSTERVGGKFLEGSYKAKLYTALSDGKPHTIESLEKIVKGCQNVAGRLNWMRKAGVVITKTEDGYVMSANGAKPPAAATAKPKAASPEKPKAEAKPAAKPKAEAKPAAKPKAKPKPVEQDEDDDFDTDVEPADLDDLVADLDGEEDGVLVED